jgi:hypothetical protein
LIRETFERHLERDLQWRIAEPEDWPNCEVTGDFVHAQRDGFGWVAEADAKRLFLSPRGFTKPDWSLAECDLSGGSWRRLGEFEPLPTSWSVPRRTAGVELQVS